MIVNYLKFYKLKEFPTLLHHNEVNTFLGKKLQIILSSIILHLYVYMGQNKNHNLQ